MKTTRQFRNMAASGLLALALAPATALTAQHGMPMGERDDMPMMQQQRGGMGMMGGCPGMPWIMGPGTGMMGPGMGMMGPGMGMMGPGMGMMGIDLNPEQQTEMRRIQRELRRQNWERMGQLMEAMEDMHELMASESPDPAAVGQAHARMAELKRPMIEARVKAMNEMRALLTDEQREQMRSGPRGTGMMPGMQDGMGGGMGPGMRGGMMGR
jgi:Spy/CpxP family protein refolding chaperone